jgi:hypothetical protein
MGGGERARVDWKSIVKSHPVQAALGAKRRCDRHVGKDNPPAPNLLWSAKIGSERESREIVPGADTAVSLPV